MAHAPGTSASSCMASSSTRAISDADIASFSSRSTLPFGPLTLILRTASSAFVFARHAETRSAMSLTTNGDSARVTSVVATCAPPSTTNAMSTTTPRVGGRRVAIPACSSSRARSAGSSTRSRVTVADHTRALASSGGRQLTPVPQMIGVAVECHGAHQPSVAAALDDEPGGTDLDVVVVGPEGQYRGVTARMRREEVRRRAQWLFGGVGPMLHADDATRHRVAPRGDVPGCDDIGGPEDAAALVAQDATVPISRPELTSHSVFGSAPRANSTRSVSIRDPSERRTPATRPVPSKAATETPSRRPPPVPMIGPAVRTT